MHLYYKYKLIYVWMQLFTYTILLFCILPVHLRYGMFRLGVQALKRIRVQPNVGARAD